MLENDTYLSIKNPKSSLATYTVALFHSWLLFTTDSSRSQRWDFFGVGYGGGGGGGRDPRPGKIKKLNDSPIDFMFIVPPTPYPTAGSKTDKSSFVYPKKIIYIQAANLEHQKFVLNTMCLP